MAKGSIAKSEIMNKIIEVFSDAFIYNSGKEVRINTTENGEPIQIKVTLTAAKVAVEPEGDSTILTPKKAVAQTETLISFGKPKETSNVISPSKELVEPTNEEKETVERLLSKLNLI